jgi:hypothetical protein
VKICERGLRYLRTAAWDSGRTSNGSPFFPMQRTRGLRGRVVAPLQGAVEFVGLGPGVARDR